MAELTEQTRKLAEQYILAQRSQKPKEGVSTVHVDEVASRVAAFYEHIRTVLEWKEEHLMRRAAVMRKLKRRFLDLEMNGYPENSDMAESLVLELIRGGHFPNDSIEETKIGEVKKVVDKYVFIIKKNSSPLSLYNWLVEIAACEIEEILCPPVKEMALIDYMFGLMKEKIRVSESIYKEGLLKKEDKDIQVYIATQQALFKLDRPMISYNLIKYKYQEWTRADQDLIVKISQGIHKIWEDIEGELSHPLGKKFYAICEKYDTPYLLLGDILASEDSAVILREISEPEKLENHIKQAYQKRLATLRERLVRAAFYSTISIFITKILSLVLLEFILSEIFTQHLNFLVLAADVVVPTVLMFCMVFTIKPPSKKNLNVAVMETIKIAYQNERTNTYEIKMPKQRGVAMKTFISLFYLLTTTVSFGGIWWIFHIFNFPATSIIINLIFIALIMFTGMAVRKRAQELTIDEGPEKIRTLFSDMLFLPIVKAGSWISGKWKKYNAIAAFFNAMIDMPFSIFVEFLEKWRYFIKEKKEEIR